MAVISRENFCLDRETQKCLQAAEQLFIGKEKIHYFATDIFTCIFFYLDNMLGSEYTAMNST